MEGIHYDVWTVEQIVIAFVLWFKFRGIVNTFGSINTLVISPIAPVLSLVLFVFSRVKNKNYFDGYIYLPMLILLVIMMKDMGPSIVVFSIIITISVYMINGCMKAGEDASLSVLQVLLIGARPIIISLVIGWLCKGMDNSISFIICCNIFSDWIVKQYSKTNRFKGSWNGFDNNGTNGTIIGAFLEAAFIGAPSDIVSNQKDMMDGLADALSIINMLVNSSMRGSATVVVTDWSTTVIFGLLIVYIYFSKNSNLKWINEDDKVWPAIFECKVPHITKLHLLIVGISLTVSNSLTSYELVSKLVIVTMLCCFVRIKMVSSIFFTANLLF